MQYSYTTNEKFSVSKILFFFFKEINTSIQQGCIKMIKSDNIEIDNITKDYYVQ